jgi:ribonuclease BN (tRNA processing enzyme)
MPTVRVQFVGSGDAFGSGGRFQMCIAVQHREFMALIDCGASSLVAMKKLRLDPGLVDVVLLTHLHGDHFGGLPFLLLDAQFSRRTRPLVIAGPPGVEGRIRQAMEVFFPGSTQTTQRFDLAFVEFADAAPVQLGELVVVPYAVLHASGAPAYALRVLCAGKVIAYSGDTEWTAALGQVSAQADLFVCEAYFYDKAVKFHLDYRTLQTHRATLDCKRLVLAHMSTDMLAHVEEIADECAEDGLAIEL